MSGKSVGFSELNSGELVEIGAQNVALQDEVGELTFADDLEEARRLQLLDMMGERSRGDAVFLVQRHAGGRLGLGSEFLQNSHAARFGERTGDQFELPGSEPRLFDGSHKFNIHRIGMR